MWKSTISCWTQEHGRIDISNFLEIRGESLLVATMAARQKFGNDY